MKNQKQYSRFIQLGNAPLCVYGNTVVRDYTKREKNSFLTKCWKMFLRKASG